jgi:hypothetical protein
MKRVKNKMLNYLKLGVFLLIIPLTLWNCKKEEGLITEKEFDINQVQKEIKPLSELLTNLMFQKKLSNIQRLQNSINARFDDNFVIDTTSVYHLSYQNYHSYTFDVTLNNPISGTYNKLVIETNGIDNTSRARLFTIRGSNPNEIESIDASTLDATISDINGLSTVSRGDGCQEEPVWIEAHNCESDEQHLPGQSCSPGYNGFPSEYGHWEYIEVCDESPAPFNTGIEGGSSLSTIVGGFSGGFGTFEDLQALIVAMGWTGTNVPQRDWWFDDTNSYVKNLLGSLFSHNNITSTEISTIINGFMNSNISNNIFGEQTYQDLQTYLLMNNYSAQACQDIVEMLQTSNAPNYVFFSQSLDSYPYQKEIIITAQSLCSPIINNYRETFSESPNIHIVFAAKDSIGDNAMTKPFSYNYVRINFSTLAPNYLGSATDLSLAMTTIHEIMHANLHALEDNPVNPSLQFGEVLIKYADYIIANDSTLDPSLQHVVIGQLVNEMGSALIEYAQERGYTLPNSYLRGLAWGGLTYLDAFETNYPDFLLSGVVNIDKINILHSIFAKQNNNVIIDQLGNTHSPYGTAPNSSTPCN